MAETLFESLFGFLLREPEAEKEQENIKSPFPPMDGDGGVIMHDGVGAFHSSTVDFGAYVRNEVEQITRYRATSMHPEVANAIDDIIDEMIVYDSDEVAVSVNLDDLDVSDELKEKIENEFNYILQLLRFRTKGDYYARLWYVDSRIYFHKMIDPKDPKAGVKDLRYIDPRKMILVRVERKKLDPNQNMTLIHDRFDEFFLYNPLGITNVEGGFKVAKDSIAYAHSGVFDQTGLVIVSHLHAAIRPLNQLRMMEDALVIYRLVRAPERRVFLIDVEDIPPAKSQNYIESIMRRYKNKLTYNQATGEVDTERRFMTMTEDFFLPQRAGKGTKIESLPGGENLGVIEDVEYFRRKLLKALHVPLSRIEADSSFNLGRPSEITRDEVKFQRFIDRLRLQFSMMFDDLLRTQLILKGVTTLTGWKEMSNFIRYDFRKDNLFTEMKEGEIMRNRMDLLQSVDPYVDKYLSKTWVQKKILHQTDEDIAQLEAERAATGPINPMMDPMMGGMGMGGGIPSDPAMAGVDGPPGMPPQAGGFPGGPPGMPPAPMNPGQPGPPFSGMTAANDDPDKKITDPKKKKDKKGKINSIDAVRKNEMMSLIKSKRQNVVLAEAKELHEEMMKYNSLSNVPIYKDEIDKDTVIHKGMYI